MTVQEIFNLCIQLGLSTDPRGKKEVEDLLLSQQAALKKLGFFERAKFKREHEHHLTNPYADCEIHVANEKGEVKRVLAGIDITAADILLTSEQKKLGKPIDLVITHHPVGHALECGHEVVDMLTMIYQKEGIPPDTVKMVMDKRKAEVGRQAEKKDHYQAIDMAKQLSVSFMSTHTATDNLVDKFMREYLAEKKPERISDLVSALMLIPEYVQAKQTLGVEPKIVSGTAEHPVGRYLVELTGGTNPSTAVYQPLATAGVNTVIGVHMTKESVDNSSPWAQPTLVIAGHMATDSLGMNLFLDELEKHGIEVIPHGGLIRVSRNT